MSLDTLRTVEDYAQRCREIFPRPLFDTLFFEYGAQDSHGMTNNVDGFRRIRLRPRVLTGSAEPRLSTFVLGQPLDFPIMIGPVGNQQRAHPEGELAAARAAGRMGTLMALSTISTYSIEEVAEVASGPLWFQLYVYRDRELNRILIQRAEQAGYSAIVVTVDQVTGKSLEANYGFKGGQLYSVDPHRLLKNFESIDRPDLPTVDNLYESRQDNLKWSDLEWLRSTTSLPFVIKGIQTAEDAVLCAEHGMEGLVVSNHGGHSLSGARDTIDALPEISDAVGQRLEVYFDGGIRTGVDVLKALALGARAVFIGRAAFWGLAVGGQAGVHAVLQILRNELEFAAGRCGVRDLAAVDHTLIARSVPLAEHWH